jgi:hypothetical protein
MKFVIEYIAVFTFFYRNSDDRIPFAAKVKEWIIFYKYLNCYLFNKFHMFSILDLYRDWVAVEDIVGLEDLNGDHMGLIYLFVFGGFLS